MSILAYFLVGTDGQETIPRLDAIDKASDSAAWYADMATSKSIKAMDRPGLSELHDSSKDGDTLIVASLDRLGGNAVEVFELLQVFKAKGVTVISLQGGFHLFNAGGVSIQALRVMLGELGRASSGMRRAEDTAAQPPSKGR